MDETNKMLLYRSFDDELNPQESKQLDQALANSEKLRKERDQIIDLRENIKQIRAKAFKPFFADRVLNKLQTSLRNREEETFFESLFILFRPVVITAVVFILIVTGYNLASSGHVSLENALGVPEVTLDDAYDASLAVVMEEENEN